MSDQDDKATRVYDPGWSSYPHHDVAARQLQGSGSMLSSELHGGFEAVEPASQGIPEVPVRYYLGIAEPADHPADLEPALSVVGGG